MLASNRLVHQRDHGPSGRYLFGTEFGLIPFSSAVCRQAKVDCHKYNCRQYCFVKHLPFRCCHDGQRDVDETLAGVVGANRVLEEPSCWERVFLETCQVTVALELSHRDDDEHDRACENLETRAMGVIGF